MGEKKDLFANLLIMAKGCDIKPLAFAKEGMLTYSMEDEGATKESGAWENPMRHSYELTGKAVVTNVNDPISELLNDMPRKVDVEIQRKVGKMPRKMKKAYRIGSRYRRDTKWKRKANQYARRFNYRLPDAEMVLSRDQMGTLEAIIRGSSIQHNPDTVTCVSSEDINKVLAAHRERRGQRT